MSTIEVGKISTEVKSITNAVNICHKFYNAGEKEIKYLTFSYVPYNSVNDIVACTASGKTKVLGKLTGPISPKHESIISWENMWFNPTVTKAVLTQIHIQYMDNTEELIEGKDIIYIDDPQSAYYKKEEEKRARQAEIDAKIAVAAKKLSNNEMTLDSISEILEEFKYSYNDRQLLAVLNAAKPGFITGYFLGDYIEKEFAVVFQFHTTLKQKMVDIWKRSIDLQYKIYKSDEAKKYKDFPEKYAKKINKYSLEFYKLPKKPGCMSK